MDIHQLKPVSQDQSEMMRTAMMQAGMLPQHQHYPYSPYSPAADAGAASDPPFFTASNQQTATSSVSLPDSSGGRWIRGRGGGLSAGAEMNAYWAAQAPAEDKQRGSPMTTTMREMMFRMAVMQPVNIDPASVKAPKRRNVRVSKDPQSVAARHRRERISERIRILQRLVPGGTKMDTASMLDEAIHYVKFLKTQVQSLERAAAAPNRDAPPSAAAGLLGLSPLVGMVNNNNNVVGHYVGMTEANDNHSSRVVQSVLLNQIQH